MCSRPRSSSIQLDSVQCLEEGHILGLLEAMGPDLLANMFSEPKDIHKLLGTLYSLGSPYQALPMWSCPRKSTREEAWTLYYVLRECFIPWQRRVFWGEISQMFSWVKCSSWCFGKMVEDCRYLSGIIQDSFSTWCSTILQYHSPTITLTPTLTSLSGSCCMSSLFGRL